MDMFKSVPRGTDSYGSGHYGASRGERTHNGEDLACAVASPVKGTVTKLGYPYGDDLSFRYVEVSDIDSYRIRMFYVEPQVEVGDRIAKGEIVGRTQSLQKRYPGITDHVHLEVIAPGGAYISWDEYLDRVS